MVPRTFKAGVTICTESAPAERIWYVRSGTVALFRDAGELRGAGVPWAVRKAGHLVGEECLVQSDYEDSAVALTPATLCAASREPFRAWIDHMGPAASQAVMTLVIKARCDESPRPTSSDGRSVRRVARWLADESRGGAAPKIPRSVVAGLLGMQPETFSRALGRLAASGVITTTRKEIRVVDPRKLLVVAGD
jgi:CRP-like cAMP-binding protein